MNSKTSKFKELLKHFVDPEEENIMRKYTEPDRKPVRDDLTTTPRPARLGFSCLEESRKSSTATTGSNSDNNKIINPSSTSSGNSTALTVIDNKSKNSNYSSNKNSSSSTSKIDQRFSSKENEIVKISGKGHEKHKFLSIKDCTFISYSSPTGDYNEISIVLWLEPTIQWQSYTERGRIVICMLYDAEQDLWSISAKYIKRTGHYTPKDEEEASISNRLCYTTEVRSEIKNMLLYFNISPREIYRMLRRIMNEDFVICNKESFGFLVVESQFHSKMMEALDKPTTNTYGSHTSYGSYDHHEGYGHYSPRHGNHHSNIKDSMKDMRETRSHADHYMYGNMD